MTLWVASGVGSERFSAGLEAATETENQQGIPRKGGIIKMRTVTVLRLSGVPKFVIVGNSVGTVEVLRDIQVIKEYNVLHFEG